MSPCPRGGSVCDIGVIYVQLLSMSGLRFKCIHQRFVFRKLGVGMAFLRRDGGSLEVGPSGREVGHWKYCSQN